jgi:hypothetical protein
VVPRRDADADERSRSAPLEVQEALADVQHEAALVSASVPEVRHGGADLIKSYLMNELSLAPTTNKYLVFDNIRRSTYAWAANDDWSDT